MRKYVPLYEDVDQEFPTEFTPDDFASGEILIVSCRINADEMHIINDVIDNDTVDNPDELIYNARIDFIALGTYKESGDRIYGRITDDMRRDASLLRGQQFKDIIAHYDNKYHLVTDDSADNIDYSDLITKFQRSELTRAYWLSEKTSEGEEFPAQFTEADNETEIEQFFNTAMSTVAGRGMINGIRMKRDHKEEARQTATLLLRNTKLGIDFLLKHGVAYNDISINVGRNDKYNKIKKDLTDIILIYMNSSIRTNEDKDFPEEFTKKDYEPGALYLILGCQLNADDMAKPEIEIYDTHVDLVSLRVVDEEGNLVTGRLTSDIAARLSAGNQTYEDVVNIVDTMFDRWYDDKIHKLIEWENLFHISKRPRMVFDIYKMNRTA